jgi:hypothetical protein
LRTTPGRAGGYQYLLGQAGYNFFFGDNMYKGTNSELSGGIYYGVGAGLNLAGTQIELLYSVNQGSLRQRLYTYSPYYGYSSYDIKGNVKYPKLSLTLGFYF